MPHLAAVSTIKVGKSSWRALSCLPVKNPSKAFCAACRSSPHNPRTNSPSPLEDRTSVQILGGGDGFREEDFLPSREIGFGDLLVGTQLAYHRLVFVAQEIGTGPLSEAVLVRPLGHSLDLGLRGIAELVVVSLVVVLGINWRACLECWAAPGRFRGVRGRSRPCCLRGGSGGERRSIRRASRRARR